MEAVIWRRHGQIGIATRVAVGWVGGVAREEGVGVVGVEEDSAAAVVEGTDTGHIEAIETNRPSPEASFWRYRYRSDTSAGDFG